MMTSSRFRDPAGQLTPPRVADVVADILRERIVDGELADGDLLPKQDVLLDELRVSRPSIREAMRILETEGLVSVRRGNVGGAEVHAPMASTAAYMLGLVMQSRHVDLDDLAQALRILEPSCAALCADRGDRAEAIVPRLRQLTGAAEARIDDGPEFTRLARGFHDEMVESCGNTTMILLVGTLETLWSAHEAQWADDIDAEGHYPDMELRRLVLRAHARLTDAIDRGDGDLAHRTALKHLEEAQSYVLARNGDRRVHITRLRSHLSPVPGRSRDTFLR
jgi:DNA-binding FadR family transcriptional regulator